MAWVGSLMAETYTHPDSFRGSALGMGVCGMCGAMVLDKDTHDRFHSALRKITDSLAELLEDLAR